MKMKHFIIIMIIIIIIIIKVNTYVLYPLNQSLHLAHLAYPHVIYLECIP